MSTVTRLLLTGASGYIGGTLLKYYLLDASLTSNTQLFALVRKEEHVEIVKSMGIIPILADMMDEDTMTNVIIDNQITIVIHTATCFYFAPARAMLKGLATIKQKTGKDVHFVAPSGAKAFSSLAGIPLDSEGVISDRGAVYEIQTKYKAHYELLQQHIDVNNAVQDLADSLDVKAYLVVPPMTYGPGEGFGNKISIQYVALVKIAAKIGKLYLAEEPSASWPLMHVLDMATLYLALIRSILNASTSQPPYGKPAPPQPQGYYFAENGNFNWHDLSLAILKHMSARSLVRDEDVVVTEGSEEDLERMGKAIGIPGRLVKLTASGKCAIRGDNARTVLGWEPKYGVDHLMATVGEEVDWILAHLPK